MNIQLPYITTELTTSILLKPNLLNNNLYNNLKNKLQDKLLNKCLEIGFITNIYSISNFSNGKLIPEKFTGEILFDVKYNARLCFPIKNTNIVGKIINITKVLIIAENGPIIIIIKINNFDSMNFEKNIKNEITYKQNSLKLNDHIICQIENTNINDKDSRIIVLAKLINMATEEESKLAYDNEDIEITNTYEEY